MKRKEKITTLVLMGWEPMNSLFGSSVLVNRAQLSVYFMRDISTGSIPDIYSSTDIPKMFPTLGDWGEMSSEVLDIAFSVIAGISHDN